MTAAASAALFVPGEDERPGYAALDLGWARREDVLTRFAGLLDDGERPVFPKDDWFQTLFREWFSSITGCAAPPGDMAVAKRLCGGPLGGFPCSFKKEITAVIAGEIGPDRPWTVVRGVLAEYPTMKRIFSSYCNAGPALQAILRPVRDLARSIPAVLIDDGLVRVRDEGMGAFTLFVRTPLSADIRERVATAFARAARVSEEIGLRGWPERGTAEPCWPRPEFGLAYTDEDLLTAYAEAERKCAIRAKRSPEEIGAEVEKTPRDIIAGGVSEDHA